MVVFEKNILRVKKCGYFSKIVFVELDFHQNLNIMSRIFSCEYLTLLGLVSVMKKWDDFLRIFGRDNDEILIMIILYYAKGNWSLPSSLETLSVYNHQNANNLEI